MTAFYALTHLIIGPSSESRCLCTYKAFMDAHAHGASGQSMKLMCRYNKAGCTFHSMTRLQCKQSAVLNCAAASPDQEATLAGSMPSSADAVRRVAPACSLHDKINHLSSSCGRGKPAKTIIVAKQPTVTCICNSTHLARTSWLAC